MNINRKLIVPYLLPAVLLYVIFFISPTIYGLYISLHEWSGFTDNMKFVGLDNYWKMLTDKTYWLSFRNTLIILGIGGVMVFLIAFIFTAMMSHGIKAKKAVRAIIFFPQIVAPIALAIVWNYLYRFDGGLFNSILDLFDLEPINWTNSNNIMISAVLAIIWYSVGFYAVLLLAGVDKIPNTIFESARLEGASISRIFFTITIPLIWDVLSIAIILWVINAIRLFDFLFAFGGVSPPQEVWNLGLYQFILGFSTRTPIYQLGYASAIAISMILLTALLVLIGRKFLKREVYEL